MTPDRKKNPEYHVLGLDPASNPRSFMLLTESGPIKARSRQSAVEQARSAATDPPDGPFLVIPAFEFKLYSRRVETKQIEVLEPLPSLPAFLAGQPELEPEQENEP